MTLQVLSALWWCCAAKKKDTFSLYGKPTSCSQPPNCEFHQCGDSETSSLQVCSQESRAWERPHQGCTPHPMSEGGYRLAVRDIIVIGCSVGGVEALQKVVGGLPAGFPGSLFVVLHIAPETYSVLPNILSRAGKLPARHAVDGELIRQGSIYVAPPDHHLVLEDGRMRLTRGPKENRHRPAIDPLFRSAARWYGPRVIGVVLTGALDDGTAGLMCIKNNGGLAIVQDPEEAFCSSMPRSAVES